MKHRRFAASFKRGLTNFANQAEDGKLMSWRLIPADVLPGMILAARRGDADAIASSNAIAEWLEGVEAAAQDGIFPACGACAVQLRRGSVCGWMILMPTRDDGTGLTAGCCERCIERPQSELYAEFKEALREEFKGSIDIMELQ